MDTDDKTTSAEAEDAEATYTDAQLVEADKLEVLRTSKKASPRFSELPLKALKELPELFQPRSGGINEQHVQALLKALKVHGKLDPLLILIVGNSYYVIDGHHRRATYRRAKFDKGVPVLYFDGTVREAMLLAGGENSKVRLPMSHQERQDFAWRLVKMDCFTIPKITSASGVSAPQISIMRKTLKTLGTEAGEYQLWWMALKASQGKTQTPLSDEERLTELQAKAAIITEKIAKAAGPKFFKTPELQDMVLENLFGEEGLTELVRRLHYRLGDQFFMDPDGEPGDF